MTHLQETNEWIFSTLHTEKIEVRCDQQPPTELLLHEFGILQMDPYYQIITPDRILQYYTNPRTNEVYFNANLGLSVPATTQMENIQNNIINIHILLYTLVAILLLLVTSCYLIHYLRYSRQIYPTLSHIVRHTSHVHGIRYIT